MPITLEALEILDAIARRGSFAAAAYELGRVPSALTYSIRKLEGDLDVLLFDRSGHRAKLTPVGTALLEEGRHLLRSADDLERRVKRLAGGWEVELRIAVDSLIDYSRIAPLVARFLAADPAAAATRLRFETEVLGGTWDALATGRVDLSIGAGASDHDNAGPELLKFAGGCQTRPMGLLDFVYCMAPTHPLANAAEPLRASDIQRHRGVAVGDTSRHAPPRTVGLIPGQDVLTVASIQSKVVAQLQGFGGGWLPLPWARPHLKRGTLIPKIVDPPLPATTLHYAWSTPAHGKALKLWLRMLGEPDVQEHLLGLVPL